ncbi:MAG: putative dehydrogenase [Paenibacillaceae bacterium]|nr:putative dehydrogenase [Paenibacillaceae bacterium]
MGDKLNVGLIGYGFAGSTFHAPVLTCVPNLHLKKVVERRSEKSKAKYPWVEIVKDAQDLFQDASIDIVVVATPSTDHVELTKEALLAGKHVVVEKPFTATSAEADELIALAKERNKVLSVFHNRRWDGDYMTVAKIVNSHLLGKLAECNLHWDRYNPEVSTARWREWDAPGTGILYDLGVHFFDQALSMFGIPQTLTADVGILREGGVATDYFDIKLRYADGLRVSVKSSKLNREPGPRYVLHGTLGSFVKYGIDPQEDALKEGKTPRTPQWGKEPQTLWGTLNTAINGLNVTGQIQTITGSYTAYYQNIADGVTGRAELAVKPEEARNAVRLIELALESSRLGKTLDVIL